MVQATTSDSFFHGLKSNKFTKGFNYNIRQVEKDRKIIKTLDRLENSTYEIELESKRKHFEKKINSKNIDKETILEELKEIDKNISQMRITIDVLDHLENYYEMNEKVKKYNEKPEYFEKKLKRYDSDAYIKLRNTFKVKI